MDEQGHHFLRPQPKDTVDRSEIYKNTILNQTIHLHRQCKYLSQKMQHFESMRDSLVTVSILCENRRGTRQSQDIQLLTKVAVIYLPFTLASAALGMSNTLPSATIWLWWLVAIVIITILTSLMAFWSQVHKGWNNLVRRCGTPRALQRLCMKRMCDKGHMNQL